MDNPSEKITKPSANKRILNEIEAKEQNEVSADVVTELRKDVEVSEYADMLFSCECSIQDCPETISISTQEYEHVHQKSMHFIVIPSHVQPDIEEIVASFPNYCVVRKLFPKP